MPEIEEKDRKLIDTMHQMREQLNDLALSSGDQTTYACGSLAERHNKKLVTTPSGVQSISINNGEYAWQKK